MSGGAALSSTSAALLRALVVTCAAMSVASKPGTELSTCFPSVGLVSVQPGSVPGGIHSPVTKGERQKHAGRAELGDQVCLRHVWKCPFDLDTGAAVRGGDWCGRIRCKAYFLQ